MSRRGPIQAELKLRPDRQDRTGNDARGIAQMIRVALVPTGACEDAPQSQKLRMLLTHRKVLQSMASAIENHPTR